MPHSHPNLRSAWPRVPRECSLTFRRGENSVSRACEGDKEGVAPVIDLLPAVCRDPLSEEAVVIGQDHGVLGPVRFEELRRALDVREQEGRRGRTRSLHVGIIPHGSTGCHADGRAGSGVGLAAGNRSSAPIHCGVGASSPQRGRACHCLAARTSSSGPSSSLSQLTPGRSPPARPRRDLQPPETVRRGVGRQVASAPRTGRLPAQVTCRDGRLR
jgi:hypothetical protein